MKTKEKEKIGSQEINVCSFCRAETGVSRQYLHAANKPKVGDGFAFIYYCADCGLKEIIDGIEHFSNIQNQENKKENRGWEEMISEKLANMDISAGDHITILRIIDEERQKAKEEERERLIDEIFRKLPKETNLNTIFEKGRDNAIFEVRRIIKALLKE